MLKWTLLWVIVLISLYTDLKTRKILNKVILPGVVLAFSFNLWYLGTSGVLFSLTGLLMGLALFMIPFMMGGMGAGDVKLMGFIGSVMGTKFAIVTGLGTGVAGGLVALVILLKQKKLGLALKRIWYSLALSVGMHNLASVEAMDKEEYSAAFPYGVAIAIGVGIATLYFAWHL